MLAFGVCILGSPNSMLMTGIMIIPVIVISLWLVMATLGLLILVGLLRAITRAGSGGRA